jgi:hypothetical protein
MRKKKQMNSKEGVNMTEDKSWSDMQRERHEEDANQEELKAVWKDTALASLVAWIAKDDVRHKAYSFAIEQADGMMNAYQKRFHKQKGEDRGVGGNR